MTLGTVLLVDSAGITTSLTKLCQPTARWLVVATLASLGMLVQIPAVSRLLNLRPLHGNDWALGVVAFALIVTATLGLASRLRHHPD